MTAPSTRPRDYAGYPRLWTATTVSDFGTYVTMIAVQLLVIDQLHASPVQAGLVNAARWVPYLLFGLLAGIYVDRHRRRPVLIVTDLGRALLLGVIPLLAVAGGLSVYLIAALMVPIGVLALLNDAAYQSYLPRLVAPVALNQGYARLEQSSYTAQASGPLIGGGLVALLTAPFAVLVDAASYLGSGLLIATIRVTEPAPTTDQPRRRAGREIREGLAWVYRHPMLAPMALSTHGWFVFNSMIFTVLPLFAVRVIGVGAFGLGVVYAGAGVGGILGSALSNRVAGRWDVGPAVVVTQLLLPLAALPMVLAPHGTTGLVLIAVGEFLFWAAAGVGGPIELTYRQAVTPDRLQGRMNGTIRSLNWGMNAVGAPLGGVLAGTLGYRPALWVGIGGIGLAAGWLALSRFRHASVTDATPSLAG